MKINEKFKGKHLLAWDPAIQQFAWVSPRILTSTVYDKNGTNLDDLLTVTPDEILKKVESILAGAPQAYDTFLEVSQGLEGNKNSILELLREISTKIPKPTLEGAEGQVLKLDKDGKPVWADDLDTIFEHPTYHDPTIIKETKQKQFVSEDQN